MTPHEWSVKMLKASQEDLQPYPFLVTECEHLKKKYEDLKDKFIKINTDLVTKYEKKLRDLEAENIALRKSCIEDIVWTMELEPGLRATLLKTKASTSKIFYHTYQSIQTIYYRYLKITISKDKAESLFLTFPAMELDADPNVNICEYVITQLDKLGLPSYPQL